MVSPGESASLVILSTVSVMIPFLARTSAVPPVETSSKPMSVRRLACVMIPRLSRLATEIKTQIGRASCRERGTVAGGDGRAVTARRDRDGHGDTEQGM